MQGGASGRARRRSARRARGSASYDCGGACPDSGLPRSALRKVVTRERQLARRHRQSDATRATTTLRSIRGRADARIHPALQSSTATEPPPAISDCATPPATAPVGSSARASPLRLFGETLTQSRAARFLLRAGDLLSTHRLGSRQGARAAARTLLWGRGCRSQEVRLGLRRVDATRPRLLVPCLARRRR